MRNAISVNLRFHLSLRVIFAGEVLLKDLIVRCDKVKMMLEGKPESGYMQRYH